MDQPGRTDLASPAHLPGPGTELMVEEPGSEM